MREKIIAARLQRLFEVILPESNRRNFDEFPGEMRHGITVHFVKRFREAAEILFA